MKTLWNPYQSEGRKVKTLWSSYEDEIIWDWPIMKNSETSGYLMEKLDWPNSWEEEVVRRKRLEEGEEEEDESGSRGGFSVDKNIWIFFHCYYLPLRFPNTCAYHQIFFISSPVKSDLLLLITEHVIMI